MPESIEELKKTEGKEVLERARQELAEIQKEEKKSKSPDALRWKSINVDKLNEEDLRFWDRSKKENFAWEEFQAYQQELLEELKEKENNSREIFINLLSDKVKAKIEKQRREEINRE